MYSDIETLYHNSHPKWDTVATSKSWWPRNILDNDRKNNLNSIGTVFLNNISKAIIISQSISDIDKTYLATVSTSTSDTASWTSSYSRKACWKQTKTYVVTVSIKYYDTLLKSYETFRIKRENAGVSQNSTRTIFLKEVAKFRLNILRLVRLHQSFIHENSLGFTFQCLLLNMHTNYYYYYYYFA
jgi:hypothetical protein